MRVGLSLSGGGFRATLFHLGVVTALRRRGLLKQVTEVSGVSGGAIMAAHLVRNWSQFTGSPEEFDRASRRIIRLCQRNVRGRVVRRRAASWMTLLPLLSPQTQTGPLLEHQYRQGLLGTTRFSELNTNAIPRLSILATSLTTGQLVALEPDGWRTFPAHPDLFDDVRTDALSLAWSVAASAAFPILSTPFSLTARVRKDTPPTRRQERLPDEIDLQLTDGGVYDNLGALWLAIGSPRRQQGPLDLLLASNAGRPFRWSHASDPAQSLFDRFSLFRRNMRANDLFAWRLEGYDWDKVKQFVRIERKFWIDQSYTSVPGTPSEDEREEAASVRTDLNRFSYRECQLLRKHGAAVVLDELSRRPL